jgi:hypothetical protein
VNTAVIRMVALMVLALSGPSLYGRGLAKVRKGLTSAGEADIAAATAVQPRIETKPGSAA